MVIYLPGEITDIIISFVDNRQTLCTCMLVCREWTPASRAILFEEIFTTRAAAYDSLVRRIIQSDSLRPYLAYTRILRIDSHPQDPDPPSHQLLYDIVGPLSSLRTLVLGSIDWSKRYYRATEPLLFSQFSHLRRLTLHNCCMPSVNYLYRALTAAPVLETLSLHHVTWSHMSPLSPVSRVDKRPALLRLSVNFTATDIYIDHLLLWLGQTPSRTSITHLLLFSHESSTYYRNTYAITLRPETLDRLTALLSCMNLTTLKVNMSANS